MNDRTHQKISSINIVDVERIEAYNKGTKKRTVLGTERGMQYDSDQTNGSQSKYKEIF